MKKSQGETIIMMVKSNFLIVLIAVNLSKAQKQCYGPKTDNDTFNIQNCEIYDFHLGDLRFLLKKVIVVNAKVQHLNDSHFKDAKELTEIEICSNEIKDISCRAFEDQGKLTKLSLAENKIELLNAGIFDPLVNLEELTLEDNHIKLLKRTCLK